MKKKTMNDFAWGTAQLALDNLEARFNAFEKRRKSHIQAINKAYNDEVSRLFVELLNSAAHTDSLDIKAFGDGVEWAGAVKYYALAEMRRRDTQPELDVPLAEVAGSAAAASSAIDPALVRNDD